MLSFREEFLDVYLSKSSLWPTDSISQVFFDRVGETVQEAGMPTERLHGDPRLDSEAAYRAYLKALWDRYCDGTLSVNSSEY